MTRKHLPAAIATLLMAGLSASVAAQTLTDEIIDGEPDSFLFSLVDSGQARFTVVWGDAPDVLALLVGCDDGDDVLIFATSIPNQDRVLSADVGIPSEIDCVAVVDIFVGLITDYTINLQVSSPDGNILDTAQLRPFTEGDAADPRLLKLADDLKLRAQALRAAMNRRDRRDQS